MKTPLIVCLTLACIVSAQAETREVKTGPLTLNVPVSWKQQQPTSSMRALQFAVPAADGDKSGGELVVFYFGAGQGGGVDDNINRWVGQFSAEGRKVEKEAGDSANGKVSLVKITGTYNKSVGPPMMRKTSPVPGSRMLGAIVETKAGNYFVKFTGPEKTVSAADADFKKALRLK